MVSNIPSELKAYGAAVLLLGALSFIVLGATAMRTVLGMAIILSLPTYLLLRPFDLSAVEKAIFALFAGLTIVPSLVYWLGFVVSFRLAITLVFMGMMGIAIALNHWMGKREGPEKQHSE